MFTYSFHSLGDNVNTDNVKAYCVAKLETELAQLDAELADAAEFVRRTRKTIEWEREHYGRETPDSTLTTWISNSEGCQAADRERRLIAQTMLDALLAS
jgi:hypothetical protein